MGLLFVFAGVAFTQMYRPGADGTRGFAFINESNLNRHEKVASQSLARRWIEDGERFDDRREWRKAVLRALMNVAVIVDRSVTQYEVEYEVGDHLHRILNAIDKKDKAVRTKFRAIEEEANRLKTHIDALVAETNDELASYMKQTRKEIVRELRAIVNSAIDAERKDVEDVKKSALSTISAMNTSSTGTVVVYFLLFQVLLGVSVYVAVQYAKIVF